MVELIEQDGDRPAESIVVQLFNFQWLAGAAGRSLSLLFTHRSRCRLFIDWMFFEQSPKSDFAIALPPCFLGETQSPSRVPPVAAAEDPSAVAKHDKPTRIPVDTGSVD